MLRFRGLVNWWQQGSRTATRRYGDGSDAEILTFGLVMGYQNARERAMTSIRHFRELEVYQEAMSLVMRVTELTKSPGRNVSP